MNGTVSNVLPAKLYGFISGRDGLEYFFHKEEFVSNWQELVAGFAISGANIIQVSFDPMRTQKGPRAKNVSVIEL